MKIVKSSCTGKKEVRTCTFSPQVNIKNKREPIQTQEDVNAAHSEAKIQDLIEDLKNAIYTKVKAVATSESFGFDEAEVNDYFFVDVTPTEIGEDHHEAIRVEVRGEVSYEGLEDLMEALNPIIESYDSYAYFEPVEPGIIEAYVSVNQIDMSIYGATASPDHMFYDYHGKRFSIHDNSSEIGEDSIDDVYFLWKGNISQQAGAYNDADEDYVYAFIRGRGVIEYYKKGKYVATDNYTLRDEDDFEYAWEYMEIILQHICDRLIAYNKDVPDRMVYNSTSIQAADDEFHGYADVASDIESALKDGIHQFFQSDKYNWSDDQIQDKTVVDVAWAVLRDDKGVERHSLIIDVYAEANRRIIERLGRFLDQLVLSKYDSYDKFTWVDQYSIEGLVYLDEYLEDIESYTSIEASDDDEFHGYADVASSIDQDTKNCLTQFFGSAPYDWSSDDIKDRTVVDIAWAVIKDNDGYDRHSLIVDVYAEANRRTITKLGKLLDKQVLSKYESFDKFVWVDQYSIEGIVYLDLFSEDVNSSTSIQSSDSYEYDGANYEFVTNIDGYWVYRAVVDGKGTWRAMPQGSDESEFSRLSFPISYDQARGFEPINEPSAITKLRKDLGKKLLPKSGQSVEATEDLSSYPEEFRNAYQKAKTEFINRYPNLGVSIIRDDPYAEDGEVAVLVKDYDTGDHAKCYLVYSVDELISSDYEWMLQAFEETAEAIGIEQYPDDDIEMSTFSDKNDVTSSTIKASYDGKFTCRIDHYGAFDNGRVLHNDWRKMSNEQAELLAKQYSENDPENIYYVHYDNIMDPASDYVWYQGEPYMSGDLVYRGGSVDVKGVPVSEDEVLSSTSVTGAFNDLEDQYLSPPEYDDRIEHEDSEELIEVEINQVITVDVDGDYEWEDDTYVWASPDESNEEWRSEDGVYIDDKVGVVEHIDDLIIPNVPTRPGKYRVTGLAKLVYDVSGIQEYRTEYGPDDYDSDIDIDHAVVSFNFRKSEVQNLKITPVRR